MRNFVTCRLKGLRNLLYILLLRFRQVRMQVLIISVQMMASLPNPREESAPGKHIVLMEGLSEKAAPKCILQACIST